MKCTKKEITAEIAIDLSKKDKQISWDELLKNYFSPKNKKGEENGQNTKFKTRRHR